MLTLPVRERVGSRILLASMGRPTDGVLVLIPAYQEAPRIAPVIELAAAFLPVVVVDDGSTDDTAAVAERSGATVIRQQPNQGKGAALRAGFRHALGQGHAAVITLDADGQHDPGEIPAFVAAWERTASQLVIGHRDFRAMPPIRRLANDLGQRTFSFAVGRHIPDNQSGFRLVGRDLMVRLLPSREDGFAFEVEMITTAIRSGMPIEWVPIRTIYQGEPSHIRPVRHVASFLRVTRSACRTVREPLQPVAAQSDGG
jgi:glycosyltransferase involved in cell wall biosynthesis